MEKSYIGVTGIMTREQAMFARAQFKTYDRLLMLGVLASPKGLRGENKWPKRYPRLGEINSIFFEDPFVLNLIHYSTDEPDSLDEQLWHLLEIVDEHVHGFQLNMTWPDPDLISSITHVVDRVVLQIGHKALAKYGNNPVEIARALDDYQGVVTDVLVDASGGKGIPLDTGMALQYADAITERYGTHFGLVFAGGLSGDTLHLVEPILDEYPDVSLDAEGKLRDAEDMLVLEKMQHYLHKSVEKTRKRQH